MHLAQVVAKRGKDRIGLSLSSLDRPGLHQHIAHMRGYGEAAVLQVLLDRGIDVTLAGGIAAIPVHGLYSFLGNDPIEDSTGLALVDKEGNAKRAKRLGESLEAQVLPPARCGARRSHALVRLVDEERHHPYAGTAGGRKRRVIGQAQVVAQPDEAGWSIQGVAPCFTILRLGPAAGSVDNL